MRIFCEDATLDVEPFVRAAHNLTKVKRCKLSEDEIAQLLVLLAEGATNEKIQRVFLRRFGRRLSSKTIADYRKKYATDIVARAQELERLAIDTGLSKRALRMKKLQALAEAIEECIYNEDGSLAEDVNPKLLSEYRGVMTLLATEAGDINTQFTGDALFVNMSDEELKQLIAGKFTVNKDLAVIIAEKAGIRPTANDGEHEHTTNSGSGNISESDTGAGETEA